MSRENLADSLAVTQSFFEFFQGESDETKNKNLLLIQQYKELQRNVIFFDDKLQALKQELIRMTNDRQDVATLEVTQNDIDSLVTLVDTTNNYLAVIKCGSFLSFKTNKMSEDDMAVFEHHRLVMRNLLALIESPNRINDVATSEDSKVGLSAHVKSPDELSQLISDSKNLAYNVPAKNVWARRCKTVLTGLAIAVAAVAVVAFMMTPVGHITAVAAGVVIAVRAAVAIFGIGKAPVIQTPIHVGGGSTDIATTVPSTAGALLPAFLGVSLVGKLGITNPPREEAARNMQAATINKLTNDLNKKIHALAEGEVRNLLLTVVKNADKMFNDGVNSWFHESQQSKMKKARLILSETAKIVEGSVPESVEVLLKTEINSAKHTFGQLLNAQRNASFFSNRTSTIAANCAVSGADYKAVDLTAFAAA